MQGSCAIDGLKKKSKEYLWTLSPTLYKMLTKDESHVEFTIGIVAGNDVSAFATSCIHSTPVISRHSVVDIPAEFVADPFMIRHNDQWHMFFEIMNRLDFLGCIGRAISDDGKHWSYGGVVLKEPFHLAYPHVFQHDGHFYMVPDSLGSGVLLYRATNFPNGWRYERTLVDSPALCDSNLFQHDGRWWILSCEHHKSSDALLIYYADDLKGPWHQHPELRISEPEDQRQAGRVVDIGGELFRFVQNQQGGYGRYVRRRKIVTLTTTEFAEVNVEQTPILEGSGHGWNADGMHHIDLHVESDDSFLACVDGVQRF